MDPKRTREALAVYENEPREADRDNDLRRAIGKGRYAPWERDIERLLARNHPAIQSAAQWAVDLFVECENCKDGQVFDHVGWHDCSFCKGRGFSLNQDFVEFLYNAEARIWNAAKNDTDLDEPLFDRVLAFLLEGPNGD